MSTVSPIPPERALIHHDGREHAGRAERRFLRSAHPFAGEHVHGCRKLSPAQTEQCWQGPATVDAFDERRLARARWTAHHDDFALGDFRRAMIQHLKLGYHLLTLLSVIMGRPQRMIATRRCSRRTSCEAANEIAK